MTGLLGPLGMTAGAGAVVAQVAASDVSAGHTIGITIVGLALGLISFLGKRAIDSMDRRQEEMLTQQAALASAIAALKTDVAVLTEKVVNNNNAAVLTEKVVKLDEEVRGLRKRSHELAANFQTMLLRLKMAAPAETPET